jgi:hypothetical protein
MLSRFQSGEETALDDSGRSIDAGVAFTHKHEKNPEMNHAEENRHHQKKREEYR